VGIPHEPNRVIAMSEEELAVPDTEEVVEEAVEEVEAPEAEESEPEATDDKPENADSEPEEDTKPKRNFKAERRIKNLTRKLREQDARIEQLSSPGGNADAPNRDSFDSEDAYLDAAVQHREDIKQATESQMQEKIEREEFVEAVDDVMADAKELIDDFDSEFFTSKVPITQRMAEAITESEKGPDLVKSLYENPAEAKRISRLSGYKQVQAIARLEAGFDKPKPKSKAPDPVKPVKSGKVAKNGYHPNMSDEAYDKWRKSHKR